MKAIIALALALVGCGVTPMEELPGPECSPETWPCPPTWGKARYPLAVYANPGVEQATEQAIAWWNSRPNLSNRIFKLASASVAGDIVIRIAATDDTGHLAYTAPTWITTYPIDPNNCELHDVEITVDPRAVNESQLIAHELGHALGLDHTEAGSDDRSLMNCFVGCDLDNDSGRECTLVVSPRLE